MNGRQNKPLRGCLFERRGSVVLLDTQLLLDRSWLCSCCSPLAVTRLQPLQPPPLKPNPRRKLLEPLGGFHVRMIGLKIIIRHCILALSTAYCSLLSSSTNHPQPLVFLSRCHGRKICVASQDALPSVSKRWQQFGENHQVIYDLVSDKNRLFWTNHPKWLRSWYCLRVIIPPIMVHHVW